MEDFAGENKSRNKKTFCNTKGSETTSNISESHEQRHNGLSESIINSWNLKAKLLISGWGLTDHFKHI
jgi:hypothetical protein